MRHKGVILGAFVVCLGWVLWRLDYTASQWGVNSLDNIDYETFRQDMHTRTAHMDAAQRNRRNAQSER